MICCRLVSDDLFACAEQKVDDVAKEAETGCLIEYDRPALGRLENVTGKRDAHESRQRTDRVHDAEHGACVFWRLEDKRRNFKPQVASGQPTSCALLGPAG